MRNYTVTSVWGIPIRVNVSLLVFLPVLAWLIGSGEQIEVYAGLINGFTGTALDPTALAGGTTPWVIGVVAAVGLFVSVAIHELGHAWAARRYGIETESITLWILGGLASLKSMPKEWNREFWIALAGPVTSVLVGAVCYAAVVALPASTSVATFVFGWLVVMNVTLAAFNMLPAFPMDGGRILRALLARRRPYATATRIAARVGSGFAVLFAVVGVLAFSPLLLLLALFVYGAANGESRIVAVASLLEGLTAADVMRSDAESVPADATLADLLDRMLRERRTAYPVEDAGSVVGVVSLADARRARKRDPGETRVRDVMAEGVRRVPADADAFEVLALLNERGVGVVLVPEAGEVAGVVTQAEFASLLQIRREGEGLLAPRVAQ